MTTSQSEFRTINYANTDEFGGAKLFRGEEWLGTVWLSVCGWSWCLVCHPNKIGGSADDFDDGTRKLLAALEDQFAFSANCS